MPSSRSATSTSASSSSSLIRSKSHRSISREATPECPTTPPSSPPPETFQPRPSSTSSSSSLVRPKSRRSISREAATECPTTPPTTPPSPSPETFKPSPSSASSSNSFSLIRSKSRRSISHEGTPECPTTPPSPPPETFKPSPREAPKHEKLSREATPECPTTPPSPSLPPKTFQPSPTKAPKHDKISLEAAPECPTTPRSSLPDPSQLSPSKAISKHDKELKLMTNMVEALALKLKKRDRQVQKLQEKADKFSQVSLELESAKERIVDMEAEKQALSALFRASGNADMSLEVSLKLESAEARMVGMAAENKSLSRRVRGLQSTIQMQDVEEHNRWNKSVDTTDATNTATNKLRLLDSEEFRQVRLQCDTALLKAGEMSICLAESRSETDELRDQLAAVTNMLEIQTCAAADAGNASCSSFDSSLLPPSPASVVVPEVPARPSLRGNLKDLSTLWDSGRSRTKEWAVSSRSLTKEWVSSRSLYKEQA